MASRPHETVEIDGVSFRFEALPFEKATNMLADVFQIISKTLDAGIAKVIGLFKSGQFGDLISTDEDGKAKLNPEAIARLLPVLMPVLVTVSGELAANKDGLSMLKWLEPRLLENSQATMRNEKGAKERLDLIDAEDRAKLFDAHPSAYLLALFLAGKLTFARYFPVAAAAAGGSKSKAAAEERRESDASA